MISLGKKSYNLHLTFFKLILILKHDGRFCYITTKRAFNTSLGVTHKNFSCQFKFKQKPMLSNYSNLPLKCSLQSIRSGSIFFHPNIWFELAF